MQVTQEIQVRSLGLEESLEKEMATHASILSWKIPWTEKPGRLPSVGLQSWAPLSTPVCFKPVTHLFVAHLSVTPLSVIHLSGANLSVAQGRSPGVGNGTPLQYSCLKSPMDRETWRATIHEVTKRHNRVTEQHQWFRAVLGT